MGKGEKNYERVASNVGATAAVCHFFGMSSPMMRVKKKR